MNKDKKAMAEGMHSMPLSANGLAKTSNINLEKV